MNTELNLISVNFLLTKGYLSPLLPNNCNRSHFFRFRSLLWH